MGLIEFKAGAKALAEEVNSNFADRAAKDLSNVTLPYLKSITKIDNSAQSGVDYADICYIKEYSNGFVELYGYIGMIATSTTDRSENTIQIFSDVDAAGICLPIDMKDECYCFLMEYDINQLETDGLNTGMTNCCYAKETGRVILRSTPSYPINWCVFGQKA